MNRYFILVALLLSFMPATAVSQADDAPGNPAPTDNGPVSPLELPHDKSIDAIALTPDGKMVATTTFESKDGKGSSTVRLWSLPDGKIQKMWSGGQGLINRLVFSPDGQILAASNNGTLALWNLQGQRQKTWVGHKRDVESLVFSPDGKTLVSGSLRPYEHNLCGELFLWDVATGRKREILMEEAGGATSVAFSSDGTQLVSPQSQFVVGIWDVQTLELKRVIGQGDTTIRGVVTAVAFSADGRFVATGDSGHGLKVWDAHIGQLQAVLLHIKDNWNGTGPSGSVEGVAFGADGGTLISGGSNQEGFGGEAELLVWNWPKKQITFSLLRPPSEGVRRLVISADGKTFATTGTFSSTVKVWHLP